MKTSELKLRIITTVDNMIDVYYGDDTIVDKMANSTLKILVKTNVNKLDDVFKMFEDENGDIDAASIVSAYADQLSTDGEKFDIRRYIRSEFIKSILPDKYLIISKDDILSIINDTK